MSNLRAQVLFRILDSETRLLERADQKAQAFLSMLGIFMVFFVVYWRVLPVNPFLVTLVTIYFGLAMGAIIRLISVLRPRVQETSVEAKLADEPGDGRDPTFFGGITRFSDPQAYREYLAAMAADEQRVLEVFTRHIYSVAKINRSKYRNIRQGSLLVVLALTTELVIIAYVFMYHAHGVPSLSG